MSRNVDLLEVMRLWGDGDSGTGRSCRRMQQTSNRDKGGEISGGKSDASYHDDFILRALRRRACRRILMFGNFRAEVAEDAAAKEDAE
jgi:hypothetical protein